MRSRRTAHTPPGEALVVQGYGDGASEAAVAGLARYLAWTIPMGANRLVAIRKRLEMRLRKWLVSLLRLAVAVRRRARAALRHMGVRRKGNWRRWRVERDGGLLCLHNVREGLHDSRLAFRKPRLRTVQRDAAYYPYVWILRHLALHLPPTRMYVV